MKEPIDETPRMPLVVRLKTLSREKVRNEIQERLRGLTRDAQPHWGGMSAGRMLSHLTESLRMALGEIEVPARSGSFLLRHAPFKQLAIHVVPFMKGLPTAPQLLAGDNEAWDINQTSLTRLLGELATRTGETGWPAHPIFGPMTRTLWCALGYRHFDHHLRQFGV